MKVPAEPKKSESHNIDNSLDIKRGRGRPVKYNAEQLQAIKIQLDRYIDETDDPTLAGFIVSSEFDLNKEYISSHKEYSDSIKKLVYKQEVFLTSQHKNPTLAIFRLKQPLFGYSDRTEVSNTNLNINVVADMTLSKDFTAFLKKKTTISTSK